MQRGKTKAKSSARNQKGENTSQSIPSIKHIPGYGLLYDYRIQTAPLVWFGYNFCSKTQIGWGHDFVGLLHWIIAQPTAGGRVICLI